MLSKISHIASRCLSVKITHLIEHRVAIWTSIHHMVERTMRESKTKVMRLPFCSIFASAPSLAPSMRSFHIRCICTSFLFLLTLPVQASTHLKLNSRGARVRLKPRSFLPTSPAFKLGSSVLKINRGGSSTGGGDYGDYNDQDDYGFGGGYEDEVRID